MKTKSRDEEKHKNVFLYCLSTYPTGFKLPQACDATEISAVDSFVQIFFFSPEHVFDFVDSTSGSSQLFW